MTPAEFQTWLLEIISTEFRDYLEDRAKELGISPYRLLRMAIMQPLEKMLDEYEIDQDDIDTEVDGIDR